MENPSDQPPAAHKQLPPPEVNPLLNPVLERNLGRWAEVYFTSPPEERDKAVVELIRELKAQNPEPHDSVSRRSPESDLEWLRSKNLSLAYEQNEGAPRWIWKVLAPIVALVVAGFLYSQWKARPPVESYQPAVRTTQRPAPQTPAPVPAESANPQAAPPATSPKPVPAETLPVKEAQSAQSEPANDQTLPTVGGEFELQRAESYLQGSKGPRDSRAAADWLWRAVRRQNPTAGLLLADLYLRGDGVGKNCEQARLLLVAAAKRGQPQAADRLRNLEANGCQ